MSPETKAALAAVTALDDLSTAVEDFDGFLPGRNDLLIDLTHATQIALRARKALAAAVAANKENEQ